MNLRHCLSGMKTIVAMIAVATVVTGCGKSQQEVEAEQAKAVAAKLAAEKAAFDARAKPYIAHLKEHLKDPDSAQLKNLSFASSAEFGDALCGEVNAKNSYGGYVGFSSFAVADRPFFSGSRVTVFNASGSSTDQVLSKTYLTLSGCLSGRQPADASAR